MKMKQLLWGFLMIASVALAGCGSNGDGGRIADLQDLLDAANVDLTKANVDLTKANDDLAKANDDLAKAATAATDLEEELGAANGMILALNIQIAAAPTQEMVDELTSKRDEYKKEAEGLQTMLDAANTSLDTVNDRVTELEAQVAKLTTPDPNTMAQAISTAILLPDRQGNARGIDDKERPGRPKGTALDKVSAGKTVKVGDDTLGVPDTSIEDANEFAVQSTSPASLQDFDGSTHMRSIKGVTDKLHVYTDKEDPTDQAYLAYFAETNDEKNDDKARPEVVSMLTDAAPVGTVSTDSDSKDGLLTFKEGSIVKGERSLFVAGGFPSGSNRFMKYENDPKTVDVDEREFKGTFSGISGTFACGDASKCRAENDGNGLLEKLTGLWTFAPDGLEDNTKVEGVIPDQDYLSFGFWLQETVKDGKTTYGVSTFYGGRQAFTTTGRKVGAGTELKMSNLIGPATYTGDATGMFVKETFTVGEDGSVVGTPTSEGQFTAYAELTARFGGDEYGKDANFEIDGTVSKFRHNGQMIDANWEVELKDAPFADASDGNHSNVFSGTTSTGPGSTAGQWNGGFFGDPSKDTIPLDSGDKLDPTKAYPNSVAGEFNGHFDNGNVIGAFGATR